MPTRFYLRLPDAIWRSVSSRHTDTIQAYGLDTHDRPEFRFDKSFEVRRATAADAEILRALINGTVMGRWAMCKPSRNWHDSSAPSMQTTSQALTF